MTLMPIFRSLLILSLLILPTLSQAKTIEDKAKVAKVSDFFMSQVLSGEAIAAFSLISAYLGVDASSFEERGKKAELSLNQLNTTLGKPLSFALLEQQAVGEHFFKITY